MPTQYDRERLRHTVVDQKEPTLEDLNDYITHYPKLANNPPSCRVTYYKAAKLKRNARLLEKDTLTLTMSRQQLLHSCNPHWTDGLTIKEVSKILTIHARAVDSGKEDNFFEHFEEITAILL